MFSAAGSPLVEHIRRAAALRLGLGPVISAAARSPAGARALIYSLLLSPDEPTHAGQLELLGQKLDAATLGQVNDLLPDLQSLDPRVKLPLIDLSLPALRHLDPAEYHQFAQLVQDLIESDSAIDLFEYTLQKRLFRHLRPYYELVAPPPRSFFSLESLVEECGPALGISPPRARGRISGSSRVSTRGRLSRRSARRGQAPLRRNAQPGTRGLSPRSAGAGRPQREAKRLARLRPDRRRRRPGPLP